LKLEKTMFTLKLRNSGLTAIALIAMASLLVTVQDARAAQSKHLSKKEVVALITNAKSPEEHLRLAQYYKAEADRLEVEAKEHDEMAAAYRKNSTWQASAAKGPMRPDTPAHCEYFAKSVREAAKAAQEMAASHEQMAKDAAANRK
jgi:hypothetical protein